MEHSESITMISCPLMCTSKVSRVFTDIYQSSSCCRTSNIIFIFYTLFICCATQNVIEDPQIQTSIGIFRGKRLVSVTGRPYFAFLGIPYATPPVGPLRFKKPLPHPGWRGVGTFRQYRPGCPQFDSRGTVYGQEDCLYMNVYVPYVDRRDTTGGLLPVMAYIHAESFENGDGSIYGPDKLMEKPVILVTFNYRLGILGFLSTEDESAAGNWGLYDQKMALDWIQLHIRSFSGDPARVTIFGQGAGAASVFFHITSPLSQGLFSRAIMQSGSGLCHWALEEKPLEYAQAVADSVGCPTANTKVMVDCLRTMPVEKLLWTQGKGKIFGEFPQRAAPVVEHVGVERIIPQEPRTSLSSFPLRKVPVIIGLNKDETSYFYPLISQHFYNSVGPDKERVLLSKFLEAATPFQGVQKDRVIRVISQRYFDHIDMNNATQFVASFINMTTDALYLSCIDETAKLLVASGYPVNFYYFEYKGENSMVNLLLNGHPTLLDTGVCHGDELFYLFNLEIDRMRKESFRDQRMTQRMTTLWSDFATYSYTPRFANYEFPNWEKFDPVSLRYYRIGETLYIDRSLRQSDAHFWTYHLPEYAGKNAASLPLREQAAEASLYRTLAWSMVALSTGLLIVVFLLLLVLYMQRRKQSFDANSIDNTSSRVSGHSESPRS